MMIDVLKVINLKKLYGKMGNITKALNGVNLTESEGEFIGIMWPSGSGKPAYHGAGNIYARVRVNLPSGRSAGGHCPAG